MCCWIKYNRFIIAVIKFILYKLVFVDLFIAHSNLYLLLKAYPFINLYTYTCKHLIIYTLIHVYIYTCIQLYVYTFIRLYNYTSKHLYVYTFIR